MKCLNGLSSYPTTFQSIRLCLQVLGQGAGLFGKNPIVGILEGD